MNEIMMKIYGIDLTGREYGQKSYKELHEKLKSEVLLNFSGVSSIGSSFADEFVGEIAKLQNDHIKIANANRVIKSCLNDVATEKDFVIEYL
jgi:anti-anti-sigma regulatory factor